MIQGNDKLIVVLGMAHSGTTVITHVLKQHPDVQVIVGGNESWLYENDWLPLKQSEPIQNILNLHPNKKILLKRPQIEVSCADWMKQEMPDAKYIYCYRNFKDISKSWSAPTSVLSNEIRTSVAKQQEHYNLCWDSAWKFAKTVKNFKPIFHVDLLIHPNRIIDSVAKFLGLAAFKFNVSTVSSKKEHNVKSHLWALRSRQ